MKLQTLLKEAWRLYHDWEKRKGWNSDYSGPHTTPEEDAMARMLLYLLHRIKAK